MNLQLKYLSKKGNQYFFVDEKFNPFVVETDVQIKLRKNNFITINKKQNEAKEI